MLNNIKSLINRVEDLENKFGIFENETIEENNNTFACTSFSKKLINYSLLETKNIVIAEFDIKKNENLYFTCQIDANLQSSQNLYIKLYVGEAIIYNGTKSMLSGEDEVLILASYLPTKSKHVTARIEITPAKGILVTIKNIRLIVTGLKNSIAEPNYNVIEVNDKYLISIIKNNLLYYSYISKTISEHNLQNLTLYKTAKSHSLVYLENLSKLFLFRVDQNNKLFVCDFEESNEYFITDNVETVSAASDGEKIIACFIKKNSCYMLEIRNLPSFFIEKRINFNICSLKKCLVYFNQLRQKFYLVLTDKNNSNYLIESEDENYLQGENIKADYCISVSTYRSE